MTTFQIEKVDETYIKFCLSNDLLIILTRILLSTTFEKYNEEQKKEAIDELINIWKKRIEQEYDKTIKQTAKKLSEKNNEPFDVSEILVKIFSTEYEIIKNDFIKEIKKTMYNKIQ